MTTRDRTLRFPRLTLRVPYPQRNFTALQRMAGSVIGFHREAAVIFNGKGPACPADAISFIEREAAAYDMKAVLERQHEKAGISLNSQLRQWPVQIKLVPVVAPYFNGADLLIAADCTAYAYSRFHEDFIKNHVTVIGCTKLDSTDYSQKFAEIFRQNTVRSVTVVRMEVPCCGGMEHAVKTAIQACGKEIPCNMVTISTDGRLLS